MSRNDLVDRIVVGEFGIFEDDPLSYTADRSRAIESMLEDGVSGKDAQEAWGSFERRYLTTGDGGTTLSAHGLDRARTLGEDVLVDGEVRTSTVEVLRDTDGSETEERLRDEVGAPEGVFLQSLWTLRRRGIVETHTDPYAGDRSVALAEPESLGSHETED